MILFVFNCVPIYHEQSCLPFSVLNINLLWFWIREELGMLLQCIASFWESFQNFPENGKRTIFIHGIKFLSTLPLGKSPDGEKFNLSSSVTGYSVVQISFIKTVEQPKSETWTFLAIISWILDSSYGNKLKDYKLLFSAVGEKKDNHRNMEWNSWVYFKLRENFGELKMDHFWHKITQWRIKWIFIKTPLMRANRQSTLKLEWQFASQI